MARFTFAQFSAHWMFRSFQVKRDRKSWCFFSCPTWPIIVSVCSDVSLQRVSMTSCDIWSQQSSSQLYWAFSVKVTIYNILFLSVCLSVCLSVFQLGLHDISHVIFNAHLVSKAGSVISGKFPSRVWFHMEQHLLHRAVVHWQAVQIHVHYQFNSLKLWWIYLFIVFVICFILILVLRGNFIKGIVHTKI